MTLLERERWFTPGLDRMTRIALVEDHQLLSAALSSALTAEGYEVTIPQITTMAAIRDELFEATPQVILLDLDLGDVGSGEDLVQPMVESGACVLVVSGTTDQAKIGRCLERGAIGWLSKGASLEELLSAVLDVAAGHPVLGARERQHFLDVSREQRRSAAEASAVFEHLTQREAAVLGMLMCGQAVERIAVGSFVAESTVRTQVRCILQKLAVNSQLEAVALASRFGWSPPAP